MLLMLGEDGTRPMAERAKTFLDKYTRKAHYIDTRSLSLPGVPEDLRGEISPIALNTLAEAGSRTTTRRCAATTWTSAATCSRSSTETYGSGTETYESGLRSTERTPTARAFLNPARTKVRTAPARAGG